MPRAAWVTAVICLVTGFTSSVVAQPLAPVAPVGGPPLASTPVTPTRNTERPPAILGAPVAVAGTAPATSPIAPAGYLDATPENKPQPPSPPQTRAAGFGAPSAVSSFGADTDAMPAAPIPASMVDASVTSSATSQPPPVDLVNDFLTKRSGLSSDRDTTSTTKSKGSTGWPKLELTRSSYSEMGDRFEGIFGARNGEWFRSDHMFDGFISPVTNPFLFEDPRSLTELRPIFIYQGIPSRQPDFNGGHISYFGTQARVAITDRWSLVLNKFGGIGISPNHDSVFDSKTGFAEIWMGPKYTFFRGEETGSIAAGGLQFQLPVGSSGTFQNTGTLSLVPYVSYGQNFLRDFRLGSFNFLASTGYAFSINHERSDYYYLSAHLDFDAGNLHRFYPLLELNWIVNTTDGRSTPIGSEGRDLINFGGQASGSGLLTIAFGGRIKITEAAQIGTAFELPLAGRSDLFNYRFTLDFILRY